MKGDVGSKTIYQEIGCTHKIIASEPEALMTLTSNCVIRLRI